uniref:Transcriptional regulator n=1 Tax=Brugia timori TaxID=42155 RepID=A0A0R3R3P0_9BILA
LDMYQHLDHMIQYHIDPIFYIVQKQKVNIRTI